MKNVNTFAAMWGMFKDFTENCLHPDWSLRHFFYSLRHFFFDRYDIVRMPKLKRTGYYDTDVRMYYAVMELVREFYEKSGWKNIVWYDETDEDGNITCSGMRYGTDSETCLFPEYKGKYVIDIVREIYDWQREGEDRLEAVCHELSFGDKVLSANRGIMDRDVQQIRRNCKRNSAMSESKKLVHDYFERYNLDWEVLDKYLDGDRSKIIDKHFDKKLADSIEKDIELNRQKYLHLAIEVREYLWT